MARPVVSVIDPDEGVRESLCALLNTLGLDVVTFTSAEGFLTALDIDAPPACLITELHLHGMSGMDLQRRLLDLGVVPGTPITAEFASPGGDPTAYRIRGALIALRRGQAGLIQVEPAPLRAAS